MGYRSQVALMLPNTYAARLEPYVSGVLILAVSGDYTLMYAEWLKWYDNYSYVQAVNQCMEELEDNCETFSFLRIGEDSEDVETRGDLGAPPFCLCYDATITIDGLADATPRSEGGKSYKKMCFYCGHETMHKVKGRYVCSWCWRVT